MQEYFKIVDEKNGNNGWMYCVGIHDLKTNSEKFDPTPDCVRGGLYFTTIEYILDFLGYGKTLCVVNPLGEIVPVHITKFKTNRLEVLSMHPLSEIATWELLFEIYGLSKNDKRIYQYALNNNLPQLLYCMITAGCKYDKDLIRSYAVGISDFRLFCLVENIELFNLNHEKFDDYVSMQLIKSFGTEKNLSWILNKNLWNKRICTYFAFVNNLDLLRWAFESGYHMNEQVLLWAQKNGNQEMIDYARVNNCPEPAHKQQPIPTIF